MFKISSKTKEPDNSEKAYEYAVFLLSLRLRTVGEVQKKMQGRGYSQAVIDEVIERLKQQKYLDDQRYAEIYLENLKKYKTFGFYGIKKKFMEKFLPANVIESVLSEGLAVEDEIKIAERFLKKYTVIARSASDEAISYTRLPRSPQGSLAMTDKQKFAQKLKARGFRSEVIAKLIF